MNPGRPLTANIAPAPAAASGTVIGRELKETLGGLDRPELKSKSGEGVRLAIVGTRGIPARYGGFETFADRLAPMLVERHGFEVTVIGDASCETGEGMVGPVRSLSSRHHKSKNPLRFYWDSLGMAAEAADIVLICGTPGGALAFRINRRTLVAVNPDGLESRRDKWSKLVQWLFVATERASTLFGHTVVCDSPAIETYYKDRHRARRTVVAEYGASPNPFLSERRGDLAQVLAEEGRIPGRYHLVVARWVPENQIDMIVEGYGAAASELNAPLLIVSDCPDTKYTKKILAALPDQVKVLGTVFDQDRLSALRAGACSYIHGHTVGGTNPSLLEAMASANLCICHDNVFNRATTGEHGLFFGGAQELAQHLLAAEQAALSTEKLRAAGKTYWQDNYTWEQIADKYAAIFVGLLKSGAKA